MKKGFANIMKRAFAAMLAICFVTALASCGEKERSVFWYEEGLYGVRCTVETNKGQHGSFVMKLTYGELDHALIESPAELAGTDFVRGDGISFVDMDGNTMDMTSQGLGDINLIFDAFSQKEEDINSIIKNEQGKTELGIIAEGGVYTVILDGDGLPEEIHFDGSSVIRITDITILDKDSDTGEVGKIEFLPSDSEGESETVFESE